MKRGDYARLQMKKVLCTDAVLDTNNYVCSVYSYDVQAECIYLVLESGQLSDISLDAIYECQIEEAEQAKISTGRVRQRYRTKYGNLLEFQVENGFYKISIK